jgi:hypothetical protein
MGEIDIFRLLVKKCERNRLLRRPRCRWEDNIKRIAMRAWTRFNYATIGTNGCLL